MRQSKTILLTLLLGVGAVLSAPKAYAVDISITTDGVIEWYSDMVLGENTDTELEDRREKPLRSIPPTANQKLRVKPDGQQVRVELKQPSQNNSDLVESQKTDRLRLELPAHQNEQQQQLELAKKRAMTNSSTVEEELKFLKEKNREKKELQEQLPPEILEQRKRFQEKIIEERKERLNEKIEIQNKQTPRGQELDISSRQIKAALKNQQVSIDPETNTISIITKDGTERVLTTLPDQAIERIKEKRGLEQLDEENLEIREIEGKLEYVARAKKAKRLFGIFQRELDTEVAVNEEGEVTETVQPRSSVIGRFLDQMSF
ncbi:hypothetical protein KBC79_04090 [Candidatus Woesebacteria bacterium]|nr:hypothetical protein [Candidatus Woesebacteria bacterium]